MENVTTQLQDINAKIAQVQRTAHAYNQAKEELDLQQHELNNVKQRLSQSSFQQHQAEIAELKQKNGNFIHYQSIILIKHFFFIIFLETLKENIAKARETQENSARKIKDIEVKLADAKGYQEREKKSAMDAMKTMQKKSETSRKNWQNREQEYETLVMEIEELKTSILASKEQLEALKQTIINLQEQVRKVNLKMCMIRKYKKTFLL